MKALEALITALAERPEILGIVTLCGIMGWMVKRRKGGKNNGHGTPYFDHAIRAQWWGVILLGAVIIIRELGKAAIPLF